jgi:hypothetical protein
MCDETYNGWSNRETWAVALHINNDQGWQESVLEAVRGLVAQGADAWSLDEAPEGAALASLAGELIRENVEESLTVDDYQAETGYAPAIYAVAQDIGSLWRVNWQEIGASFLEGLDNV